MHMTVIVDNRSTGEVEGEKAYTILKDVLGEKLHHLKVGLEVDF